MYRGAVFVLLTGTAVAVACSSFEEGTDGAADAGSDVASDVANDVANVEVDGGTGADASTCACPGRAPCGVPLVAKAGAFCIDPHEVTEAAFGEFVTANLNQTLSPGAPCGPLLVASRVPGRADVPVTLVTFCEARAYCTWAGKRLCGHVTGRPLASGAENADLEQNAWLKGCLGNGAGVAALDSGTCRTGLADDAGPAPVKTTCEGAFPGLFEMQGNVWEWIDAPSVDDAGLAGSFFMGGSWTTANDWGCATAGNYITAVSAQVGFRCCSP
jgi:formylglycine-generating enzyme